MAQFFAQKIVQLGQRDPVSGTSSLMPVRPSHWNRIWAARGDGLRLHRDSRSSSLAATTSPVSPAARSGGTEKGSISRPSLWDASHIMKARPAAIASPRRGGQAQQHAQPLFPDGKLEMLELFVQVMILIVDQGALFFEERVRVVTTGAPERQSHGHGIDARASLSGTDSGPSFSSDTPAPTALFLAIEPEGEPTGNMGTEVHRKRSYFSARVAAQPRYWA